MHDKVVPMVDPRKSNEPLIMAPNDTLLNHIHFSWVGTEGTYSKI